MNTNEVIFDSHYKQLYVVLYLDTIGITNTAYESGKINDIYIMGSKMSNSVLQKPEKYYYSGIVVQDSPLVIEAIRNKFPEMFI